MELKSANHESFPYIMHIVDEPRKFSPLNVLTYRMHNENKSCVPILLFCFVLLIIIKINYLNYMLAS